MVTLQSSPFLIFWHSGTLVLNPRVPECQKIKGWVRPVWPWIR